MTKLRQAVAIRIVDIDRTTFENAVAKGDYTSVPPTSRGAARLFGLDDLVPLWIFARLIEARGDHARERMSVKEAGKVTRRIHDAITQSPEADHIAVMTGVNDSVRAVPLNAVELPNVVSTGAWSGSVIRDIRIWDVRNIRRLIERAIAEASDQ